VVPLLGREVLHKHRAVAGVCDAGVHKHCIQLVDGRKTESNSR
jgi:hypothetical protein